jgi:hypothetical protein
MKLTLKPALAVIILVLSFALPAAAGPYEDANAAAMDWTASNSNTLDVEGGCALHFAQGLPGDVVCIVYPFSSRLIVSKDKHYVYRLFRPPDKITDKNLNDAVRVMFAMAHHSSFAGNPGWDDRYAYAKLHFYSLVTRLRHADWTKMAFAMLKKVVEKLLEKKDESSEADDEPQADATELSV